MRVPARLLATAVAVAAALAAAGCSSSGAGSAAPSPSAGPSAGSGTSGVPAGATGSSGSAAPSAGSGGAGPTVAAALRKQVGTSFLIRQSLQGSSSGQQVSLVSTGYVDAPSQTFDLSTVAGGQKIKILLVKQRMYVQVPGLAAGRWVTFSTTDPRNPYRTLGSLVSVQNEQIDAVASSKDVAMTGTEQVGGVATTKYAGTVTVAGVRSRQEWWIDAGGRVLQQRGAARGVAATTTYSDYGVRRAVQAPPAAEVVDGTKYLPSSPQPTR